MTKQVIIGCLLEIFTMIVCLLYCSRTDINLISQYSTSESYDIYEDSRVHYYYYSLENPVLIDSIVTNWTSGGMFESTQGSYTHRFTHSMQYTNGITSVTYNEYEADNDLVGSNSFIMNPNSDPIEIRSVKYIPDYDSLSYEINYLGTGQTDSICCFFNHNLRKAAKIYYDSNNRLSSSVLYNFYNVWYPEYKYDSYYSDNSPIYNSTLDFSNLRLRSLKSDIEELNWIFDKNTKPDSILVSHWNGESWVPLYSNTQDFFVSIDSSSIALRYTNDGDFIYCHFNNDGLLINIDKGVPQALNLTQVFWFNYTSMDDETIPLTVNQISTYPDPFKSDLNIKFISKDKAPSDISIYNIKGQLIRSWKDNKAIELSWDGRDNHNQPVSSGMYLIKAKQGRSITTAKVIKY